MRTAYTDNRRGRNRRHRLRHWRTYVKWMICVRSAAAAVVVVVAAAAAVDTVAVAVAFERRAAGSYTDRPTSTQHRDRRRTCPAVCPAVRTSRRRPRRRRRRRCTRRRRRRGHRRCRRRRRVRSRLRRRSPTRTAANHPNGNRRSGSSTACTCRCTRTRYLLVRTIPSPDLTPPPQPRCPSAGWTRIRAR